MATFCLLKEQIDTLKAKLREVGAGKLVAMSSKQRLDFFTEALGATAGKELAVSFERALISKQQGALKNWAKNVFTEKEKSDPRYQDIIGKIDRLQKEGALNPVAVDQYLEQLVSTSLGLELKPEEIQKINELSQKIQTAAELPADNIFGIPNIEYFKAREEMNNYLQSITEAPLLDVISGIIGRGNLLASIKSPVTNVVSNITGFLSERVVRRMVARKASGVNSDLVTPFIKHAYKVYKETGYDVVRMLQLQDESKTLGEGRTTTQGEGNIRKVARFYEDVVFKKAMGTPDVLFAAATFADSLNVNSTKLADLEGLSGEEHKKRARELFLEATALNPNAKTEPVALREQAISDALYATYQDQSWIAETTLKIRRFLDDVSGGLNLGTNLEPFVKTPANVVKTTIEYSGGTLPFVVIRLSSAISDARNGNPETLRSLMRTAVRSGIGLTTAFLIASMIDEDDYIPDYAFADARQKELVRLNNAAYNSIRIGDTWISLDYFGVLGASIAGFANAKRTGSAIDFSQGVIGQLSRLPVINKVHDIWKWYEETKRYQKTGEELLNEAVGDLVNNVYVRTVPMIISDMAKATDDSQRLDNYDEWYDNILMNVPYMRESLPPKYSDLGEVVPTENALYTIFFGARVKSATDNVVVDEINRLHGENVEVTLSASKMQEMVAAKNILSTEEYNEFQAAVQRNIATAYEKTINLLHTKKATDEEKESMLEDLRKKIAQTTARNEGYYSRIQAEIKEQKRLEKAKGE